MKLLVANRTLAFRHEHEDNWWPNPEWVCAPHELIQIPTMDGVPPVTGPFRFRHEDLAQAKQYALEQNWDALQKMAVPERIPPNPNA